MHEESSKYALSYSTPAPPDITPEAILSQKLPQITITQKIFRLHLTVWKRVGLVGVFLLEGIATVASIVRLAVIMAITSRGFNYTEDEDLAVGIALYWGMIETILALVATCLPTVSSGITKLFGRLVSTTRKLSSLQSRSTKMGSSAKGVQSANQYYEMSQTSIAASKLSTRAQYREGEANFSTEEHFTGDTEAARLRP